MKKLAAGIATTAVIWTGMYLRESPRTGADWVDRVIVTGIAVTFTFAAIVMLASRRSWTIRAVGLFLSSTGIAVLFGEIAYIAQFGRIDPGTREGLVDLARAALGLGGLLLFLGLSLYSFRRWGPVHYQPDVLDETPGDYPLVERRKDPYGRRITDQPATSLGTPRTHDRGDV